MTDTRPMTPSQARSIQCWGRDGSNHAFDVLNPEVQPYDIHTIAHALSNICRFNGHCSEFYSVAQHSVFVSRICEPRWALHGLLHDAAEAYVGDTVQPLKRTRLFKLLNIVEQDIQDVIYKVFDVDVCNNKSVSYADLLALAYEARDFMTPRVMEIWQDLPDVSHSLVNLIPLPPKEAEAQFLKRYDEIMGGKL